MFTTEIIAGFLILAGLILIFIEFKVRLKFFSLSLGAVMLLIGIWMLAGC